MGKKDLNSEPSVYRFKPLRDIAKFIGKKLLVSRRRCCYKVTKKPSKTVQELMDKILEKTHVDGDKTLQKRLLRS